MEWPSELFSEVWVPDAVVEELREGQRRGYHVPDLGDYAWLSIVSPRSVPSEWLTRDLVQGNWQRWRWLLSIQTALFHSLSVLLNITRIGSATRDKI